MARLRCLRGLRLGTLIIGELCSPKYSEDASDLEESLQQNMNLRRELGAELTKVISSNSSGGDRRVPRSAVAEAPAPDSHDLEELRRELKSRLTK